MLSEDPDFKECLLTWEAYIQEHKLAVAIEQATEEGVLTSAEDIRSRLAGCPTESVAREPPPGSPEVTFGTVCLAPGR
jgi:hypothetical protein